MSVVLGIKYNEYFMQMDVGLKFKSVADLAI
jgi:hypothetical protein